MEPNSQILMLVLDKRMSQLETPFPHSSERSSNSSPSLTVKECQKSRIFVLPLPWLEANWPTVFIFEVAFLLKIQTNRGNTHAPLGGALIITRSVKLYTPLCEKNRLLWALINPIKRLWLILTFGKLPTKSQWSLPTLVIFWIEVTRTFWQNPTQC